MNIAHLDQPASTKPQISQDCAPRLMRNGREVSPYINAIGHAASLIESGIPLSHAASGFLDLPGAERCYLLDSEGRQIGENMINPQHRRLRTNDLVHV